MFEIQQWLRPSIASLSPYTSARDEFSGSATVYLDANENPFGTLPQNAPYHRYPDPLQKELKQKIVGTIFANEKKMEIGNIFLGNGSDEAIDLLIRLACEPNRDSILICSPTYSMYAVSAQINSVKVKDIYLNADFQLDVCNILTTIERDASIKIIFISSPNNPTGNSLRIEDMKNVLQNFDGVVVIDEAYIDFSTQKSMLNCPNFPNLVILRTFSKAWAMAALRLGMAVASVEIIAQLNKIKSPYNINQLTQNYATSALQYHKEQLQIVESLIKARNELAKDLEMLSFVERVYRSDANFLLVKFKIDATKLYQNLLTQGIVVRNRSQVVLCQNCLRITIGTLEENKILWEYLNTTIK